MQQFYAKLAVGNLTKAQALQQAQVAMIQDDESVAEGHKRLVGIEPEESAPNQQAQLSHPYYWAPFILIGNGL